MFSIKYSCWTVLHTQLQPWGSAHTIDLQSNAGRYTGLYRKPFFIFVMILIFHIAGNTSLNSLNMSAMSGEIGQPKLWTSSCTRRRWPKKISRLLSEYTLYTSLTTLTNCYVTQHHRLIQRTHVCYMYVYMFNEWINDINTMLIFCRELHSHGSFNTSSHTMLHTHYQIQ